MASVDTAAVKAMMARMKIDLRKVIEAYATEASELSVNSPDPHTPIIGCMQMALANAASEYLISSCGTTPIEGFQLVVNTSGQAMRKWVEAAAKNMGLQLKQMVAGSDA